MAERTPEEDDAYFRLQAAAHEAGHLTASIALGRACCSAWIRRNKEPDYNPIKERPWIGASQSMGEPVPAAIGMAGMVAECLHDDPACTEDEILEFIDLGSVLGSESDWAYLDRNNQQEVTLAVRAAIELLTKERRFFEWAVKTLLEERIVTDGMAAKAYRKLGKS
jgi:hypothetical protein